MKIARLGVFLFATMLCGGGSDGNPGSRPYAGMPGGVMAIQFPAAVQSQVPGRAMYDPEGTRQSTTDFGRSGDRTFPPSLPSGQDR